MGGSDDYCSEEQTAKIKTDLTRHLAGDFSPGGRRAESGGGDVGQSGQKAWDKDAAFCPNSTCY